MRATARYDWGRWLADCPAPDCTSATALRLGQQEFHCNLPPDGCAAIAPIDWPDDPAAIATSLADRPESQRHWRPE